MAKIHLQNLGEDVKEKLDSIGSQGIQGIQGIQGEKGDMGDSFTITKSYLTIVEMNNDFNNPLIPLGSFVIISSLYPDNDPDNGKVYIKKETEYKYQLTMRGLKGEKGDRGPQGLNGLQGLQGISGSPGKNGTNASVNLGSITKALGYIPANKETTDDHALSNATKTSKGHMQVGDGLNVTDGVVSIDSGIDGSYGIYTPIEDFPLGITEVAIITNESNQNYIDLRSLVSDLMGYELKSSIPFKFFMKTSKRTSSTIRQEVVVTANYSRVIGVEYFRLHRDSSGGEFSNWNITVSTITGKGSPENAVTALKSCLYSDATNGILYKKTTGTIGGTITGWKEVVAPKQLLSLSNAGGSTSIGKAPFDIKLTTVILNNEIPYNESNGHFTLTGGKIYKIQYVANINTTGRVEIRVLTAAGGNVTSVYGLWGDGTSDKSPNMYSTLFQPSSTANYKLSVTVHSVSSSTISRYTSHLEIIEL